MSANWTNYSVDVRDDGGSGPHPNSDDGPACTSCKKRKLRCSRDTPACSHCVRLSLECVYAPKQKPGLKTGALEGLSRRVAFLERILLDEGGKVREPFDLENGRHSDSSWNDAGRPRDSPVTVAEQRVDAYDSPPISDLPSENRTTSSGALLSDEQLPPSRKRKLDQPTLATTLFTLEDISPADNLPSQPLLAKLADYFCISFHHWIPYLHKQRLRDSVSKPAKRPRSDLVLHAVVFATLRHMNPRDIYMDEDEILQQIRVSRFIVERCAMQTVSLESLRALIILIFEHLNNGNASMAWPLIGSLTRTVDYLQLTLEPTASPCGALKRPLMLVQPTHDWTELEERRRLFWVIFLLDRFCSVSTGWNTSLTSEDVHRRLPADGGYFTREEPVTTPFFGIWNKTAARIGRSLAHVPAQYNEEDPATDQVPGTSPASANALIDSSKLGAFAYCVEATESLSQVTTFFLSQRINWQDKEHAVSWLTRFKELDLRLVQWKMFLPPRWKNSDISQDTQVVDMDPNLTLAHITHNTSMILLHFAIAYPPREWSDYVALPKECSAQTCQHAAVETSNIVSKFLTHTRIPFVNVQFAFCTFVAAKALLFENQAMRTPIRPEFERLLRCLWEMASRWSGKHAYADPASPIDSSHSEMTQAGRYARHLDYLHDSCRRDPKFSFDFYDHSCQRLPSHPVHQTPATGQRSSATPGPSAGPPRGFYNGPASLNSPASPRTDVSSQSPRSQGPVGVVPPLFPPGRSIQPPQLPPPTYPGPTSASQFGNAAPSVYDQPRLLTRPVGDQPQFPDQSLIDLSDTLMGSQFLDMDRVITFEDANFFLPGDAFRWQ